MEIYQEFRNNLQNYHSENGLIDIVKRLLQMGNTREQIMEILKKLHLDLSAEGNEYDDNLVLNVMDYFEGWCSPHMKI